MASSISGSAVAAPRSAPARALALLIVLFAEAAVAGCDPVVIDGPAALECGTGEYVFEPVAPDQALSVIYGAQGGQHVWIALRVENMHPRDFHVDTAMYHLETGEPIGYRFYFDVNLQPTGDDRWFYAGLPFALADLAAVPAEPVRIEIVGTDREGRVASDSMEVRVDR